MGLRGLNYQVIEVPFAAGLKTKDDPRAMQPPGLSICRDAEFDTLGALQTRYPYLSIGANILGGGTLSNVRRIVANDTELLCFTKDSLYSWDASAVAWVLKGTHLAIATQERPRFVTTDDQIDQDRAELSNIVVYCWSNGTDSYVAVADKTTNEARLAPTKVSGATHPRLVACSTRILFFYVAGGSLKVVAINPASVSVGAGTAVDSGSWGSFGTYYDVARVPGSDSVAFVYQVTGAADYTVGTLTAALVQAQSKKTRNTDGPMAISVAPDAASVQIVRTDGVNVKGDLIALPAFGDTATNQAIGTTSAGVTGQIAAAHRTVKDGGQYRCYVMWTISTIPLTCKYNWADDAGALGTQAAGPRYVTGSARAFDYNGRVYFWVCWAQANQASMVGFGASLQNTYFLFRDDMQLVAKAARTNAAGAPASRGVLPTVASIGTGQYAWCGSTRRVISLGSSSSGYAQRAPRDITFTFDSNDARRCVRLGGTMYIACGEGVLQYDGVAITEAGWPIEPWQFLAGALGAGTGLVGAGVYGIKCTWRWDNAAGEIDRSSTTNVGTVTCAALDKIEILGVSSLSVTHKTGIAVEVWRTAANPTSDSPFYLVTSKDPTNATNPNRYLSNDPTLANGPTFDDNEADATATLNETNPENGATLSSQAAPAASIIIASADRVFLGGVAGDPHSVWYSKQRADGEVIGFNDALTVPVPPPGGDMTGLALIDGTLIVFRQRAIYALPGDGYTNTGAGANYGPARLISSDCGAVNADAIALTPFGLIFKSSKGWYRLGHDLGVQYIGKDVAKFDSDTVYSLHVVESKHQVRCITNARCLMFDYNVGEWAEWTIADGLHATLWQGSYLYAATASVKQEQSTYAAVDYGMDVEMAFFKPPGLQGRMTVRNVQALGEWRSDHRVRWRVSRDYLSDGAGGWSYFDDKVAAAISGTVGGPMQLRHGPSQKQCQAMKVRITAVALDGVSAPTGEALKLTGLAFDVGVEPGLFPNLPTAQTS